MAASPRRTFDANAVSVVRESFRLSPFCCFRTYTVDAIRKVPAEKDTYSMSTF